VDYLIYTKEAATAKANVVKTSLATGKIRAFKSPLIPNVNTTRAELIAAECDYSGYPAGGYTVTAFTGPTYPNAGGAQIQSPLVNFAYISADPAPEVANDVGGYWYDDTDDLPRVVAVFAPSRSVSIDNGGFSAVCQIVEARNPTVVTE